MFERTLFQNVNVLHTDPSITATKNTTGLQLVGMASMSFSFSTTTAAASTLSAQLEYSPDGGTTWSNVTGITFSVAASQTAQVNLIDCSAYAGTLNSLTASPDPTMGGVANPLQLRWGITITGTVACAYQAFGVGQAAQPGLSQTNYLFV